MARIAGVNIPDNKHIVISLRYVYGIGPTTAKSICEKTGIEPSMQTSELSPEQLDAVRSEVSNLTVEGDLRREESPRTPLPQVEVPHRGCVAGTL